MCGTKTKLVQGSHKVILTVAWLWYNYALVTVSIFYVSSHVLLYSRCGYVVTVCVYYDVISLTQCFCG